MKELLERDGIIDRLGESRIYGNLYEATADRIPNTPTEKETKNAQDDASGRT